MNDEIYPNLSEQDQEELRKKLFLEQTQVFQKVFANGIGKKALAQILVLCHFGVDLDPNDPIMIGQYNLGLRLLWMSGWMQNVCQLLDIPNSELRV